jgi:hypothetical protein
MTTSVQTTAAADPLLAGALLGVTDLGGTEVPWVEAPADAEGAGRLCLGGGG